MANVCMLSNLFEPIVSGSANQAMGLARELVKRGNQIVVITARVDPDSAEYERKDGVHVYRLPCLRLPRMAIAMRFPWLSVTYYPANIRRMEVIIRRHEVELLHADGLQTRRGRARRAMRAGSRTCHSRSRRKQCGTQR